MTHTVINWIKNSNHIIANLSHVQNIIAMNFAIYRLCNYVLHFWNWSWSWNDFRECPKFSGGLRILYRTYPGEEVPPDNYNTKYTSLPRVLGTPSSHSNFNSNFKNVTHNCTAYKLQSSLQLCFAIPFGKFAIYSVENCVAIHQKNDAWLWCPC